MEKKGTKKERRLRRKGWHVLFASGIEGILSSGRRRFGWKFRGDRLEQMKKLHVGKGEEEIFYQYYGTMGCRFAAAAMISFLLIAAGGLVTQKGELIDGYFLKRDGILGQEKSVDLSASLNGDEKEITIKVPNVHYTEKELAKKFREAKAYVNRTYLGKNHSAEEITKPLCLASSIPNSAVCITWRLGTDEIIQADGSIANEALEESIQTEITALFSYGEEQESLTKQLTVLPREKTAQEQYWDSWKKEMETSQEKSLSEEYLKLPEQVQGKQVLYLEKQLSAPTMMLGISLFAILGILVLQEEKAKKDLAMREKELKNDYPEFVEHFVLLIGAGLNVKGAWERIALDYSEKQKAIKQHYVYEEMLVSVREMENGMGEAKAYELFGKRTGLLPYMKFCTLIVQNLKKGSDDLLESLEYEVADAFRERKENAKALGEEAGTKLLLPMMVMLVIVFVIILYSAFYNM